MNQLFVLERGAHVPTPSLVFLLVCGGCLLVLVALALLAWADRRWRWPALLLGLLGLAPYVYALNEVRTQEVLVPSPGRAGTLYPRYTESLRSWMPPLMAALPILYAVGAAWCWMSRTRLYHEEAPEHYKEGLHHYYRKNYEAALMALTAGLKIEPQRADMLCMRGCTFARLGAPEMALADLDRALASDPHYIEAYLQRGRVRAARGEYDLALADFDHVLHDRPADSECRLERGLCLERKGLTHEAVAEYEKVLRLTNHPDIAFPATERLRALGASGPAWPQAAPS